MCRALIEVVSSHNLSDEVLTNSCLMSISMVASFGCLFTILHQCVSTIDGAKSNRYPMQTVFEAWVNLILMWTSFSSKTSLNSMEMKVTATKLWAMQRLILVGIPSFIQRESVKAFVVGRLEITTTFFWPVKLWMEWDSLGIVVINSQRNNKSLFVQTRETNTRNSNTANCSYFNIEIETICSSVGCNTQYARGSCPSVEAGVSSTLGVTQVVHWKREEGSV